MTLTSNENNIEGKIPLFVIPNVSNSADIISDGCGNVWKKECPKCKNKTMQVVRPGKVQNARIVANGCKYETLQHECK